MGSITDKLELPKEVNLADAAEILGVSVKTAKRYIQDGLLIARNIAPLRSVNAVYRVPLSAVIELRTGYAVQDKPKQQLPSRRRKMKQYQPRTMKRK